VGDRNGYCSHLAREPKEDAIISQVEPALGRSLAHITAQLAPTADWRDATRGEHFAQFFETDAALVDAVCDFGASGFASGGTVVVIATVPHLAEIERRWTSRGMDVAAARRERRYEPIDARALLGRLVPEDWPRARSFIEHVGPVITGAIARGGPVWAFGEMVGLLWAEARYSAAVRLEELWNELAERHAFTLFCGYPSRRDMAAAPPEALRRVCGEHAHVLPGESYTSLATPAERLAEICELQNRARCAERELRERRSAERRLEDREQELAVKVRELDELDRRRHEYLAMLGHELRNPLAAIRNAAAVLERETRTSPTCHALCDVLGRQVRHMSRLLDDLLEVSRITRGKIALQRERCELGAIVARAVEISRTLIEERGHRLEMRLPDAPVELEADPTRLAQALGNLLHNAAKYTPPGGRITLSAAPAGPGDEWLRISVADNGMGIAPEVLPRIFEPFAQASQALERAEGGLGIGLTLVRGIVELHGGTVHAISDGPGRGAELVIRVPRGGRAAAERHGDGAASDERREAKRVMVVDDNRDAADSLALLLGLGGHQVRAVGDGRAAIEAAQAFAPDLIVMDIGLPGLDGYATARRLRESGCRARLAAVTGYGRPEDRRRAEEAGFDHFYVKPIDPQVLERLIATTG
jgi:signal transduction histidine kinase/CheY-like chemotaxis protein